MKRTIILSILIALGVSNIQAQKLKDYVKKKKQVIERELDKKTDEKLREGVDNLFKKKTDEQKAQKDKPSSDKNINTGGTDNLTGTYSFSLNIDYNWSSVTSKDKEEITGHFIQMLTTSPYTAIKMEEEGQSVVSIVDEKHHRSIILMPQMKSAIVTNTADEAQETINHPSSGGTTTSEHSTSNRSTGGTGGTEGTTNHHHQFKKTGKQQVIAGYKCDEYTWSESDSKGQMWIATDLSAYDLRTTFGNASGKMTIDIPEDAPKSGVVLKYIGKEADGTSVEVTATKVSKKTSSYDMSQYKVLTRN